VDEFGSARLDPNWQWPWDRTPQRSVEGGVLTLRASGRDAAYPADTIIARPAATGDYVVTARVLPVPDPAAFAGLSVYGNAANAIGVARSRDVVVLWRREKGVQQTIATAPAPAGGAIDLRMTAADGSHFQFALSEDGSTWQRLGSGAEGGYLPPWDLALRIALAAGGPAGAPASFDWIRIDRR
jgi:beta-xylosidase